MKATGTIQLVVEEISQSGQGVKLFYFTRESSKAIQYKAGQYLTFILSEEQSEIRRSYSLSSTPGLDHRLCIGVKRIDNGMFSRYLYDEVGVGDTLLTVGAGGLFVLPEKVDTYNHLFFFAAGSGIVPVFSLLKACLYQNNSIQVILIYSNHSSRTTIFLQELKALQQQFAGQFMIKWLFSNSQDLLQARLHPDLVRAIIREYSAVDLNSSLYYICGPEAYMRLCVFTLRGMNVPADLIKKEIFHTSRTVHKIDPPDKMTRQVTVLIGGVEHKILQEYPLSILQASRKAGLVLPYSCDTGRCGNCIAKCTSGKVWMSYNEVITEKELLQGLILTCTGHAVEGDVTIMI